LGRETARGTAKTRRERERERERTKTHNLSSVHLLHPLQLPVLLLKLSVDLIHDDPSVLGSRISLLQVSDESSQGAFVRLKRRRLLKVSFSASYFRRRFKDLAKENKKMATNL